MPRAPTSVTRASVPSQSRVSSISEQPVRAEAMSTVARIRLIVRVRAVFTDTWGSRGGRCEASGEVRPAGAAQGCGRSADSSASAEASGP